MMQIKKIGNYLLVAFSLGLFFLSSPGQGSFSWLAWIAYTPLFIIIKRTQSSLHAAWFLGLFGFCCWLILGRCLITFALFSSKNTFLAYFSLFVFFILNALPYVVAGFVIRYFDWMNQRWGAFFAAALMALLLTHMTLIFPGELLVASQAYHPLLLQVADLGGITFFLFMMILVNGFVSQIMTAPKLNLKRTSPCPLAREEQGEGALGCKPSFCLGTLPAFAGMTALFLIILSYGLWREHQLNEQTYGKLNVGIIQANYAKSMMFIVDQNASIFSLAELMRATEKFVRIHPHLDLIVWPELPNAMSPVLSWNEQILKEMFAKIKTPLYLITDMSDESNLASNNYHTALIYDKNFQRIGMQNKVHLIPIAEKSLPYFWIHVFGQWLPKLGDGVSGKTIHPIAFSPAVRIAAMVCYDDIIPQSIYQAARHGANLIVVGSDDDWFSPQVAQYHVAISMIYAASIHLPLIKANNSGLSLMTNAAGEVIASAGSQYFHYATFVGEVPVPHAAQGIYARYPWLGELLLWLIVLVGTLRLAHPTKR